MKKRIVLTSLMIVVFACVLAFSVGAADKIIKLNDLPTLEEIHENREAYVSYIEALEDDTVYKQTDPDSVVVLSDLAETPTYYVYPCYYFIRSSYYNVSGQVGNLNAAIAKADPTAFAGYNSAGGTWANGECDNVIRIEFPKYVTQIHAKYKFEGSENVKEIYFPIHTVIDEETGLEKTVPYCASVSGEDLFSKCYALEVIHNQKYLPKGLVQGNNSGFNSCYSLKEFYIPEGVTSIPNSFFGNCRSLTELVVPNSVTWIGKQAFAGCTNLQTVRFGDGVKTFNGSNYDFETFLNSPNIKYIYLPNNEYVFSNSGVESTVAKNIFSSGKNVTFFFTGTEAKAQALQGKFIKSGGNGTIENAVIVEYDPTIDYEGYADTLGYSIIVYGYNRCKAFYGDNHENTTAYGFDDGDYVSEYCRYDGCWRCGDIVKTSYGKLFVNKGYATETDGDGFTFGIRFNKEAIEAYEKYADTKLSYGFVAGKLSEGDEGKIVTAGGENATDSVFTSLFTETSFELFSLKVTGVNTDEYKARDIYCSAFIIDGAQVYYIGQAVTTEAVAISYDKISAYENESSDETEE